jgi:hypothetical protein
MEFEMDPKYKPFSQEMFETLEAIELLELLRLDFEKGIKVGLADFTLKEGFGLEDVKFPDNSEIVGVLKTEGNKYTCIVKIEVPAQFKYLMKEFDLDLIWTSPLLLSEEKMVFSCIGDEKNLKAFMEVMKKIGTTNKIRFQRAAYQEHDILSVLTDKQRDIIIKAKKNGYYEYPRKINSDELSKKVGISKATTVEHLRKAEGRLMENILAGY